MHLRILCVEMHGPCMHITLGWPDQHHFYIQVFSVLLAFKILLYTLQNVTFKEKEAKLIMIVYPISS